MIFFLLYFIAFLILINKWSFFDNEFISKRFLTFVFIIKIGIGFCLIWVYNDYYPNKTKISKEEFRDQADIFKYYDDCKIIYNALDERPIDFLKIIFSIDNNNEYFYNHYYINMNHWDTPFDTNFFNDSHTIIRLNALIRIISFNSYHVHMLIFCLLSFIGLFALFKSIVDFFPNKENLLKWLIFFTPSILFWNSGVLKEPILFFSIGILLLSIMNLINGKSVFSNLLALTITAFILFLIKFYIFLILVPLILPFIFNQKTNVKRPIISYLLSIGIFIFIGLSLKYIDSSMNLLNIIDQKQEAFIEEASNNNAGSYFEIVNIEPDFLSLCITIPNGIINCFTKPFPWTIKSIIELPQAVENCLVIIFMIIGIFQLIKFKNHLDISSYNLLIFCSLFAIANYAIIGICTPVYGALVRYKITGLLFLLFSIILLIDIKSITKKLKLKF